MRMDKRDRLSYLVKRYYNNTCSQQEVDEFLDYVKDPVYDSVIKDLFQQMWDGHNVRALPANIPAPTAPAREPLKKNFNKELPVYIAWGVAASLFIGLFVGLALNFEPAPKQVAVKVEPITSKSTQQEHRVITTPDGSTVWLNSNSELDFPSSFSGGTREVTLKGEAFFDIKHDPLRPFIIHTGKVKTTVLGTAFNIRALPNESSVVVTVTRGKVRVGDDKNATELTANQQVSVNLVGRPLKQQNAEGDRVASWTREDLIMDNITFAEAVSIIKDRYNVDVEFQNNRLQGCRFTSTFLKGASLEQMLTAICIVNRASFTLINNKVIVNGDGCEEDLTTPQ